MLYYKVENIKTKEVLDIKQNDLRRFATDMGIDIHHLHASKPSYEGKDHRNESNGYRILEEYEQEGDIIIVRPSKDEEAVDEEVKLLFKEIQKLNKSNQNYMDKIRIMRKDRRFEDRIETIVENFYVEISNRIPKFTPNKYNVRNVDTTDAVVVVQFADWHISEVVDLDTNKYNVEIAEKRLNNLLKRTIHKAISIDSKRVAILMTGDLINLRGMKHLDKLLTNEFSRAEALQHCFRLIAGFIDELLNIGISVEIASVVGNEARLFELQNMPNIDSLAIDNFDYMAFMMVKARFGDHITYLNNGDRLEDMVRVGNHYVILIHSDKLNHKKLEEEADKLISKWHRKTGIKPIVLFCGHVHSPFIGHQVFRSASLVGANGYSEHGLGIIESSVSQNLGVFSDIIEMSPIDLSNIQ